MNWRIEYYSEEIEEAILELSPELIARYLHLTDLMMQYGPNLGMPHTRKVEKGLFELRVKGKGGIARAFYCTIVDQRIIMLHLFAKKSQKIPLRHLETARKRLREIERHGSR